VRDLYEHLRPTTPVGLVTVYRTLALLRELGLVRDAGRRGHEALYAACELRQHHHHLVCDGCGAVEESTVCRCDELEAELGRRHGFQLLPSVVNHYGRCAACAASET
jgi:Fur family ferric uptake transcriptional regulator